MWMRIRAVGLCFVLFVAATAGGQDIPGEIEAKLTAYESAYYTIYTDMPAEDAKEAAIRMTRMAEEYYERTRDFSGQVNKRLPFYLFREMADYYNSGGLPGSAGVFNGRRLMAIAGQKPTAGTWMVVQHEGFHQFARAVIRGDIPTWANEGLADYFAVSVFTGDGMVSGVVPNWRLKRIQDQIKQSQFKTVEQMMLMAHRQWNDAMSGRNYDQGWSMVHFLAHGDNGKYQAAFAAFIRDVGRGVPWKDAWADNFGTDIAGFEEKWKAWWLGLKENPTADLYAKATTATFTSFLGRAHAKKQTFDTFEEFIKAATEGKLEVHESDWLPPSVLKEALARGKGAAVYTLEPGANGTKKVVCKFDEETTWVGTYVLTGTKVSKVVIERLGARPPTLAKERPAIPARGPETRPTAPPVSAAPGTRPAELIRKVDPLASAMSLARAYAGAGDKENARKTLEKAIADNPTSPAVSEATTLLKQFQ